MMLKRSAMSRNGGISAMQMSSEVINLKKSSLFIAARSDGKVDFHQSGTFCFDDLGTEGSLKYYGNECNVMAEILLTRYDLFVSQKIKTHITTNLSATEIEGFYGNRVRSRLREMFNLIAFDGTCHDKRK